ncbi:ATP-binding protein [Aquiflexum sp.]|uniref:PAS domain-containing sensor histidine kinase n=1 Tax=Aquiflexum sp. TaxID=1872584 RepID=UPI0035931318
MLERSRKLHLRWLFTTSVFLLTVLFIGYVQFSSNQRWSENSQVSDDFLVDLAILYEEFENLEKMVLSQKANANSGHLEEFFDSKNKIEDQLAELEFYIGKTDIENSDLDSLVSLSNSYLNNNQKLFLEKTQTQEIEVGLEDQMDLSGLELFGYLDALSKKEKEAISGQFIKFRRFWEVYFLVAIGLLIFLFIVGFVYHRMINSEFDSCDEAVLQNKINREMFEHAEKLAGLGHGFFNLDLKKIYFSSNLYGILGFQPKAFPPSIKGYLRHIHPEDRAKVIDTMKSLSLTNNTIQTNIRIITDSGEIKYVEVLAVLKIEKKESIVIFINRDATPEKVAELKLLELNQDLTLQNRMFKHVKEIASVSYLIIEIETNSVTFSDNLFRMLGLEPDSFKAAKEILLSFVIEEDKIIVSDWLDPQSKVEDLKHLPVKFKTINREIKFISLSREFFEDTGKILLITLKDVTSEARINQQLALQNQELSRNNAELASFNYIASHDLQEPLRKIQTFVSLLDSLEDLKLTQKAKDYFSGIQRSANRMQLLILDLLQFSRVSKVEKNFELTDLTIILRNTMDELSLLIEESKGMVHVNELPTAEVVPHQMNQLFKNLIQNSLKFRNEDVPVSIQITSEIPTEQELDQFPDFHQDDLIKITFADNGIGFDQIHAESIFVIFKRLHGRLEFPGSGIGLAICQKIIETHKGKISASGSPGEGAKFTIIIPKYQRNGESE